MCSEYSEEPVAPNDYPSYPTNEQTNSTTYQGNLLNWPSLIVQGLEEAIFGLDRNFRFSYVNQQTSRLWQRSKESLEGKSI